MKASLRGHDFATQVQMLAPEKSGSSRSTSVHAAAARGIAGAGARLPYSDQIQRSFGGYDISNVQAHTGASATAATTAMGADAYATGNHVVLGDGGTDLHTVAHEAAHVVQQQHGVSLSGGIGQAGDPYERHADAVADLVVQGQSAEGLLGEMAGSSGSASQGVQLQAQGDVQQDAKSSELQGDSCMDGLEREPDATGERLDKAGASACSSVQLESELHAVEVRLLERNLGMLEERVSLLMSQMAKGAELRENSDAAVKQANKPASFGLGKLLAILDLVVTAATGVGTAITAAKAGLALLKTVTDITKGANAVAKLPAPLESNAALNAAIGALNAEMGALAAFQHGEALFNIATQISQSLGGLERCAAFVDSIQRTLHIHPSQIAAGIADRALDPTRLQAVANRFSGVRSRMAVLHANTARPQGLAEGAAPRNLSDFLTHLVSAHGSCKGIRAVDLSTTVIHWDVESGSEFRRGETTEFGIVADDAALARSLAGPMASEPQAIPGVGQFIAVLPPAGAVILPLINNGDMSRTMAKRTDQYVIIAGISSRQTVSREVWDNPRSRQDFLRRNSLMWKAELQQHPAMREGRR
jgi:hypothetical protein